MQKILPITRNLLIINVLCYLLQVVLEARSIDITQWLGLHFVLADQFNVFQLFTYMFLHGSLTHLFFNMFSLWMFGSLIERQLGTKPRTAHACGRMSHRGALFWLHHLALRRRIVAKLRVN